ncbi:MAG: HAMP domain-containing sensor histidine kinase [Hyphomicrobiales bacterium]
MLKRRLYLQIYSILLISLTAVIVAFAIFTHINRPGPEDQTLGRTLSRLITLSMPEKNLPLPQQKETIESLGRELQLSLTLYDDAQKPVASYGELLKLPTHFVREKKPQIRLPDGRTALRLSDGRILVLSGIKARSLRPITRILVFLVAIGFVVSLVSYPFVKRLTRRLEALKQSVETIGSGNLKTRIAVEGNDEVAALATSFNEAAETIEGLVNSQKMLLANASHELRTPLSRIRLAVEMLEDDKNTTRLSRLREDIGELDDLIDEILLMSRLDTGANVIFENDVDLVAIAAEEGAHFQDCQLKGSAPLITGDRRLLSRLIRNLLQNAKIHGATPIYVELSANDRAVTLMVKDSGEGFPIDDENRLFEAFQRGPNRQNISGYGLGLALVRQIAEAHNGSVEIVPKSEAQSAIRVILPTNLAG